MGRRSKRHRVATALRLEAERQESEAIDNYLAATRTWHPIESPKATELIQGRADRINAAKGLYAKPYDDTWQQPARTNKRKWRAPVRYARSGYRYVNGDYVKLTPKATDITQIFDTNRQRARAEAKALAVKQHARRKAKALGRERYERAKPINEERLKALKADKQAERAKRLLARAHMAHVGKAMGNDITKGLTP